MRSKAVQLEVEFRACTDGSFSLAVVQSLFVRAQPKRRDESEDGIEFLACHAGQALEGNRALLELGDAQHLKSLLPRVLSRNPSSVQRRITK
jgi:hypothetical protein